MLCILISSEQQYHVVEMGYVRWGENGVGVDRQARPYMGWCMGGLWVVPGCMGVGGFVHDVKKFAKKEKLNV